MDDLTKMIEAAKKAKHTCKHGVFCQHHGEAKQLDMIEHLLAEGFGFASIIYHLPELMLKLSIEEPIA